MAGRNGGLSGRLQTRRSPVPICPFQYKEAKTPPRRGRRKQMHKIAAGLSEGLLSSPFHKPRAFPKRRFWLGLLAEFFLPRKPRKTPRRAGEKRLGERILEKRGNGERKEAEHMPRVGANPTPLGALSETPKGVSVGAGRLAPPIGILRARRLALTAPKTSTRRMTAKGWGSASARSTRLGLFFFPALARRPCRQPEVSRIKCMWRRYCSTTSLSKDALLQPSTS